MRFDEGKHAATRLSVIMIRDQVGPGKHRAIRNHVFVPHPRGDDFGCNLIENDQLNARCGFYRQQHPTMECGR